MGREEKVRSHEKKTRGGGYAAEKRSKSRTASLWRVEVRVSKSNRKKNHDLQERRKGGGSSEGTDKAGTEGRTEPADQAACVVIDNKELP